MDEYRNYKFCFYIGKDEQGVRELEEYGNLYKEHLLEIPFSHHDIDNSWNLAFELNQELSLLIDIYEQEMIDVEKLPRALTIAEQCIKKEQNPERVESMRKFASAIKKAILYSSPLLVWW